MGGEVVESVKDVCGVDNRSSFLDALLLKPHEQILPNHDIWFARAFTTMIMCNTWVMQGEEGLNFSLRFGKFHICDQEVVLQDAGAPFETYQNGVPDTMSQTRN